MSSVPPLIEVPIAARSDGDPERLELKVGQATFEMQFGHYALVPRAGGDGPFPPAIGMRA
jgi:hypothetical protein